MQCLLRVGLRGCAGRIHTGQWMSCRYRSGGNKKNRARPHYPPSIPSTGPPKKFQRKTLAQSSEILPTIPQERIIPFFVENVSTWIKHPETSRQLASFGVAPEDSSRLLNEFARDVRSNKLSDPESYIYYGLERFGHTLQASSIETIYSTIFFSWASKPDPENTRRIETNTGVPSSTMSLINQLTSAINRPYPTDEFDRARKIHRKIIMHVGPTNSGKTHHALRALAGAKSGVYAGPLRLLAHEIWERLNTGQIVPLDVEDDFTGPDPKHVRICNLLTGEEQKIVEYHAPLISCTVEMLLFSRIYDIAVIDEIQMIGDIQRGGSWFNAVAGLAARELHLCGEETAIPLVEKLLSNTGDELIIRRYNRLTPLVVEQESLGGDLSKVKKGDCVVTFSRSSIFGIKARIEEKTGLRCAVVYGRLPPEVRSEQAALFNDPNSGYDVIIGSDAIGMGLNLKIRRVIFEAVSKRSASGPQPLPVSTVKQIAGRAGRFGLLEGEDPGGTCTTLHKADLPYLGRCLATPFVPLEFTRLSLTPNSARAAMAVLPPTASLSTVVDAQSYIGRIPTFMRYQTPHDQGVYDYIERNWTNMHISDRLMLLWAPVPWRDIPTTEIILRYLDMHCSAMTVDFMEGLKDTGYLETMHQVELDMKMKPPTSDIDTLMRLESLHKVIVFYVWMNFRNPVVYAEYSLVADLKLRLEKVLNWSLEGLSKDRQAKLVRQPKESNSTRYLTKREAANMRQKTGPKVSEIFDPTQNPPQRPVAAG